MKNDIRISESTIITTLTVADLLTRQDVGEIATPDIQRPAGVWSAEQEELLADSLLRGWSVGTISLVEVGKLLLIVDGLQRITALRHCRDSREAAVAVMETVVEQARAAADGKPADSVEAQTLASYIAQLEREREELERLSAAVVTATITTADDARDAAELFVRLNNGCPLSKIQRGTAGLDPKVLEWARGWADLLPEKVGGKISRDECALVMAACAANKGKMSTNGTAAIKSLAGLTAEQVKKLPQVDAYRYAAGEYIVSMETAGNAHMLSGQYLIPYILGSGDAEHTLTREDWALYIAKAGKINAERVRSMTPAKGKSNSIYTTRRKDAKDDDRLTWGAIDADKSNSSKATVARYSAVALGDLYRRITGEPCPGDYGYKTATRKSGKTPADLDPAAIAESIAALEAAQK
mgnify:CR=1 FL=1